MYTGVEHTCGQEERENEKTPLSDVGEIFLLLPFQNAQQEVKFLQSEGSPLVGDCPLFFGRFPFLSFFGDNGKMWDFHSNSVLDDNDCRTSKRVDPAIGDTDNNSNLTGVLTLLYYTTCVDLNFSWLICT